MKYWGAQRVGWARVCCGADRSGSVWFCVARLRCVTGCELLVLTGTVLGKHVLCN